ncbi:MAG: hypothetical protein J3Q66DRAFT_369612 [Benniella sp.]|nr:MAG: hypothetical protein J3Q66DRAFT_369612 [Benniella sp.]
MVDWPPVVSLLPNLRQFQCFLTETFDQLRSSFLVVFQIYIRTFAFVTFPVRGNNWLRLRNSNHLDEVLIPQFMHRLSDSGWCPANARRSSNWSVDATTQHLRAISPFHTSIKNPRVFGSSRESRTIKIRDNNQHDHSGNHYATDTRHLDADGIVNVMRKLNYPYLTWRAICVRVMSRPFRHSSFKSLNRNGNGTTDSLDYFTRRAHVGRVYCPSRDRVICNPMRPIAKTFDGQDVAVPFHGPAVKYPQYRSELSWASFYVVPKQRCISLSLKIHSRQVHQQDPNTAMDRQTSLDKITNSAVSTKNSTLAFDTEGARQKWLQWITNWQTSTNVSSTTLSQIVTTLTDQSGSCS